MNSTQLVAHRGYMQHYPENSWPGLEAAIQAGARWLEFDVQMCADGGFVVLHDDNFLRTAKDPQSVFDITLEQLAGFSVHEPTRFGDRFAPVTPSSLADILSRLEAYPDVRCMIELKQESLKRWGLQIVMDRLLKQISPYAARHVLISFSHEALGYARQQGSGDIGLVMEQLSPEQLQLAEALAPDYLICNHEEIGPPSKLPQGGWEWMLYDIADPALAQTWVNEGVELIETCDIGKLLQHPTLTTEKPQDT